jgi:anti-anti-sigma regulatory factor
MLKIEKESDGDTAILPLTGRIQSNHIRDIEAQMADVRVRVILDLSEVTLVDAEVVRFLSDCEKGGVALVHCPPYVREWIARERTEGP